LAFFGFFVAFGNAGMIAVDIPLVQEFVPTYKRGWVAGLTTTLLPAGNTFGALSGWLLEPMISWRGLFLVGLAPALLVFMIRYWVSESLRFLMRMGRHDEARGCSPGSCSATRAKSSCRPRRPMGETTRWRELFRYPRSGRGLPDHAEPNRRRRHPGVDPRALCHGLQVVLAYLARYTHRVAISNSRLVSLDQLGVTFRYKDYRRDGRARFGYDDTPAKRVHQRCLLHVLPNGFHRVRREANDSNALVSGMGKTKQRFPQNGNPCREQENPT